ncbi:PREDICTED: uncharacterized protein LOC105366798 [Ceratosolen solmsi marchali]|uniref:Uncharacterized protein LOC105366798 n=1 Tax=Ceratosolen solmsi marchali TaxID=326594 RepID=A0AAJ6YSV9_9HYME|nr:PREDICTED: uncharacterized protein LOC105366798 [Ceratosolen solmsi marchali]
MTSVVVCTSIQELEENLQELLTEFWVQEEVSNGDEHQYTPDEQWCEDHFKRTHTRHWTGRYIVRISLREPIELLENSYNPAHQCLQSLLRQLSRNEDYRHQYIQFMTEYDNLNHMKKAPTGTQSKIKYYLPHHGALKPDSSTTKLRVVFNSSSPSTSGKSLNDLMHTGANLNKEISDVLLWIRQHRCLFATDITKMYRQILVHKDDWDLQRILWIDDQSREVPYQLTTVIYGTRAAPFLAVFSLLQLVEDEGEKYPLALPAILHGRYVDDIFGGADTPQELQETALQLQYLCMAGGFPLAKWHSSHRDILTAINADKTQDSVIEFDDCKTKILGLQWSPQEDKFTFLTMVSADMDCFTKRKILSDIAKIFDPLGFVSPVVIKAKLLLQELWLHTIRWDDPLRTQISLRWRTIKKDLSELNKITIP